MASQAGNTLSNHILKEACRILHVTIVDHVITGDVIHELYASNNQFLSVNDMDSLSRPTLTETEKTQALMIMLHKSQNDLSFIKLRFALQSQRNGNKYSWLVNEIDKSYDLIEREKASQISAHSPLNWLFLGESGVGKSSATNAIDQYLRFPGLTAATTEPDFLIPVKLSQMDPVTFEDRSITTGSDPNENFEKTGDSVTQFPRIYRICCADVTLQVIDTPGLNDTRNTPEDNEQDERNMSYILDSIADLGKLDAIVLLLMAHETRLSKKLVTLLKQLLVNLPESAKNNIVFLFTRALSCDFEVPEAVGIVKRFLEENNLEEVIKIESNKVFLFDSKPLSYIARRKQDEQDSSFKTQQAEYCWKQSLIQLKNMIRTTMNLTPVMASDLTALKQAREYAKALMEPLLQIFEANGKSAYETQNKVYILETKRSQLKDVSSQSQIKCLLKSIAGLTTRVFNVETRKLPEWRLVCQAEKCRQIQEGFPVPRLCQQNVAVAVHARLCHAIKGGKCTRCGCSYRLHDMTRIETRAHYRDEVSEAFVAAMTKVILQSSFNEGDASKVIENEVQTLKEKHEEYMKEQKTIIQNIAVLQIFLERNSLCKDLNTETSIKAKLDEAIKRLTEREDNEEERAVRDNLKQLTVDYEFELVEKRTKLPTQLPVNTVDAAIDELCDLPLTGEQLKTAKEAARNSSYNSNVAAIERQLERFSLMEWLQ